MATFLLLHGAWHLHDPHAGYEEPARPAIDALEGAGDEALVVAQRRQGTRRSSRGAA